MLLKKVHSGFWKSYDKYFHLLGQYWTKTGAIPNFA